MSTAVNELRELCKYKLSEIHELGNNINFHEQSKYRKPVIANMKESLSCLISEYDKILKTTNEVEILFNQEISLNEI